MSIAARMLERIDSLWEGESIEFPHWPHQEIVGFINPSSTQMTKMQNLAKEEAPLSMDEISGVLRFGLTKDDKVVVWVGPTHHAMSRHLEMKFKDMGYLEFRRMNMEDVSVGLWDDPTSERNEAVMRKYMDGIRRNLVYYGRM